VRSSTLHLLSISWTLERKLTSSSLLLRFCSLLFDPHPHLDLQPRAHLNGLSSLCLSCVPTLGRVEEVRRDLSLAHVPCSRYTDFLLPFPLSQTLLTNLTAPQPSLSPSPSSKPTSSPSSPTNSPSLNPPSVDLRPLPPPFLSSTEGRTEPKKSICWMLELGRRPRS